MQLFSRISSLKRGDFGTNLALSFVFISLCVLFSILMPEYFFSFQNAMNILGQLSLVIISAVGLTLVLLSKEVDISIGSLLAASAIPLLEVMNLTLAS